MKRLHQAAKRGHENGEVQTNVCHRNSGVGGGSGVSVGNTGPTSHHHTSYTTQRIGLQGPNLMDFTGKIEPHEATVRSVRISHMPPHHIPLSNRAVVAAAAAAAASAAVPQVPPSLSVNLKRPSPDDDEHNDIQNSGGVKRTAEELSGSRPSLTRGESLPTVPFVPERQPNFKDKHSVRTPSFETSAFKPGGKFSYFFLSFNFNIK